MQNEQLNKLREAISRSFNLEDLRGLAFDLSINFDDLRGEVLDAKIRALLEYQQQRGRIPDLLNKLTELRPNEDWHSFTPAEPEATSPYKGLQYFTEADQHLFFGREKLTAQLVQRLQNERFLVVVGASGSGKSSVVRAGLVPAVRRGEIEINGASSKNWPVHIITPTDQPHKTLAVSLTRDIESVTAATTLTADLQQDPNSLDLFLIRQTADQPDSRFLLVIDQFEELFTQCNNKETRQQFVGNLVTAVQSGSKGRLKLVLTLRADFYAFAVQYESLRPLLKTGQEIVGEMSEAELREAILKPAIAEGWRFQPGLVETILQDVEGEPGSLPLLSHALQETWNRREGRTMTLAGYLAAGGVRGAIAKTADTVYAGLSPDQQTLARTIFLRLTELGEGTEDTRRRVWQTELIRRSDEQEIVAALLQRLANARLITTDTLHEDNGQLHEVVEVSHEALIREWPTLRTWLDENREWLRLHRRLSQDTKEWLAVDRDVSLLYRGGRLAQVREQTADHTDELNQDELAFIEAGKQEEKRLAAESEAQRQRELTAAQELAEARQGELEAQQRRTTAVRRAVGGLAVLLVIAIIATIFAISASRQATIEAENAVTSEANAQSAATDAIAAQGTAQAEATRADLSLGTAEAAQGTAEAEASRAVFNEQLAATSEAKAIAQTNNALSALSQRLAASSLSVGHENPMASLLLAISAGKTAETAQAMDALISQLPLMAEPLSFFEYEEPISGSVLNNSKDRILIWTDGGVIRILDVNTEEKLLEVSHNASVTGANWNQEEDLFLSWSQDDTARVWDAESGQERFNLNHDDPVLGAIWNKDETRILTWSGGAFNIWNAATGIKLQTLTHEPFSNLFGAAWNNDENLILSWASGGIAKVWEADTGQELITLVHNGDVLNATWSGDGSRILTRSCSGINRVGNCFDSELRIWDAASGNIITTLQQVNQPDLGTETYIEFNGASWNDDDSRILSWSKNGSINIWDSNSGQILSSYNHNASVNGAMWNNDESLILTWSQDGIIRVWGTFEDDPIHTLIHTGVVGAIWNSDESQILSWNGAGIARVWDADSGDELLSLSHESSIQKATWNRAENLILTVGSVGFRSWNASPNQQFVTLNHGNSINGVLWNQIETRILTWSQDNTVKVWDATSGDNLLTLNHEEPVIGAMWNKDERLILSWSEDRTARVWDADSGAPLHTLLHQDLVWNALWNKDETRILTTSRDGKVRIWDTASGNPLMTTSSLDLISGEMWSEDESQILTWGCDELSESRICTSGSVRLWDATTGDSLLTLSQSTLTLEHEYGVTGAFWNEDESQILSWSKAGTVWLWDAVSGNILLTLNIENTLNGASWNSNVTRILTWDDDNSAQLWDAASGDLLASLHHENSLFGAKWNQDETRILTWSQDESIRIWDANSGELLLNLDQGKSVFHASWNKDESRIFSWDPYGSSIWDANSGKLIARFDAGLDTVSFVQWDNDGSKILMEHGENSIRIFYTSTIEFADNACQYTTRNFTWEEWQLYFPSQPYERTCPQWPVHPSVPESALP